MKIGKLFSVLWIMAGILILTGCSGGEITEVSPEVGGSFSMKADIVCSELESSGIITRHSDGVWDIVFESPESLSGVKLAYEGEEFSASYQGLSFSVPKAAVSVKAMLGCLICAVDELAQAQEVTCTIEDDTLVYEGTFEQGDYVIRFSSADGSPISFEMAGCNLEMKFSDFKESTAETAADVSEIQTETVSEETQVS